MIVQRTETHIIKESHPIYGWILEECLRSKNLYNKALFVYRQAFTGNHDKIEEYKDIIKHDKFIASFALVNKMNELKDTDFCSMMKKNGAQQIVFQVDKAMKTWFAALKSYKKDPSKFRGRPRIPSYKGKRVKRGLFLSEKKKALNADINGSLNILKRGIGFSFNVENEIFRPTKIDIQKKLLIFA